MISPQLWPFRWLFLNFLSREIKSRYVGSISGFFWSLIHPLALLAVYAFVFTAIFRVKFPQLEGHSFIVFVAVALWPWLAFQEGVQRGTLAVQGSAGLVKKVAFPHELLVHGAVGATYIVHGIGFLLVLVVLWLNGAALYLSALPMVVLILAMQYLVTSGLALLLGGLQILLKDVEHFLTPLFMVWFYATPILYPVGLVPPAMQQVIALNPMTYFADRMRDLLLYGNLQPKLADFVMLASGFVIFLAGRWVFYRLSPHFEDFL